MYFYRFVVCETCYIFVAVYRETTKTKNTKMKKRSMKAMYKCELADCAGVTTKTLRRWLKPYQQQLEAMGVSKHSIASNPL